MRSYTASDLRYKEVIAVSLVPRHGFEPRLTAPKAAVLPLDDRGTGATKISLTSSENPLPFRVGRSFKRRLVRAAFHVEDARRIVPAARRRVFHDDFPSRVGTRYGILRDLPQIAFADQFL